jgi:HK97 family phage portal protein
MIFKSTLKAARNLLGFETKSTGLTVQSFMRGDDLDAPRSKLIEPYSQSAWVYIAVSVLAENVGHIPFRISRSKRGADDVIESGPVVDLFENPHPTLTRTLFWQTLVSWEALRGEFFVLPLDKSDRPMSLRSSSFSSSSSLNFGGEAARTRTRTTTTTRTRTNEGIASLLPLNPDHFQHIIQGNHLAGWRYNINMTGQPFAAQVLLPEEVIHSRNFNPYLFWRGLSPLTVALLPATADYAAAQFMKGVMLNNGDAGLIVTTPDMLTPEQREQLMASLQNRKRGAGIADKPAFIWGNAKIDKPLISSVDMQFMENRRLNRQEIGAIYKVPESMMGFTDNKSALSAGSSVEQDRLNFIESTMTGICRRLEAAMQPVVRSFGEDLYGWFDLESLPILQNARRNRIMSARAAFEMGVPFNSVNQVYQLGFPNFAWGNDAYLPTNFQKVGHWAPTRSSSSPNVTDLNEPSRKLLALLERSEVQ